MVVVRGGVLLRLSEILQRMHCHRGCRLSFALPLAVVLFLPLLLELLLLFVLQVLLLLNDFGWIRVKHGKIRMAKPAYGLAKFWFGT